MDKKIYYSKELDDWLHEDLNFAYFFYIPRKWWSIKAWKLMFSFRAELQRKLFSAYNKKSN